MSRIEDIIDRARDTLADPDGDRWTDTRLLRLVQDAQNDIAYQSRILRSKVSIPLLSGVAEYDLPDNTFIVTRAMYNNERIPFKSHLDMDRVSDAWVTDTGGEIQYVVYDKQDRKRIRLYPIPDDSLSGDIYTLSNEGSFSTTVPTSVQDAYNTLIAAGVTVDPAELGTIVIDSDSYGVLTGLTGYILNSEFGVVTDIADDSINTELFTSDYGVVTSMLEQTGEVVVYYVRKPVKPESVTDDLELDDAWDQAIRHYVIGMALKDDKDTQNRQFAGEELKLYDRQLKLAKETSELDSTDAGQYEVPYISGV